MDHPHATIEDAPHPSGTLIGLLLRLLRIHGECLMPGLREEHERLRDRLRVILSKARIETIVPPGPYRHSSAGDGHIASQALERFDKKDPQLSANGDRRGLSQDLHDRTSGANLVGVRRRKGRTNDPIVQASGPALHTSEERKIKQSLLDELHTVRRRLHAELCDVGEFVEALRRFKRFIRRYGLKVALKEEQSS
jgi:hypothetical protein